MGQITARATTEDGDDVLEITCPECGYQWWVTYRQLQRCVLVQRTVYRGAQAPAVVQIHQEQYLVRCPNLDHDEDIVVTVAVEEE